MSKNHQRALEEYVDYYEKMSPRSIRLLEKLAVSDMHFQDPFNDVIGIERVEAVFQAMFRDLDDPQMRVSDHAWGRDGMTAYLKWRFTARFRGKTLDFTGMSEVLFTTEGKVLSHVDYWDAAYAFYEKLPVIGAFLRKIRRKVAAG